MDIENFIKRLIFDFINKTTMPQLIFKIDSAFAKILANKKAGRHGKSKIEIMVQNKDKKYCKIAENTDSILSTLDKVLKSAKLKIEQVKNIKIISHKEVGLTSQRIVRATKQALDF